MNVIKKLDNLGMISIFPTKNQKDWLLCDGSETNNARLVSLLRREAFDTCVRIYKIVFDKNGEWYHPLAMPSKYWTLNTICIWYMVEHTGRKPLQEKKDININIPLNSSPEDICSLTFDGLKSVENIQIEKNKNILLIKNAINISDNNAGVKIEVIQKGCDIKKHPFWHEDKNKAHVPNMDTGINCCYYMIRT